MDEIDKLILKELDKNENNELPSTENDVTQKK